MQATREAACPWSPFVTPTHPVERRDCCSAACCIRLLALGLIIVDKRYDHLGRDPPRCCRSSPTPCKSPSPAPSRAGTGFAKASRRAKRLRADKAKLEAELRLAQFRLQRYEALEAESQRLRALRDNTAGVTDRFIIGDIMDVDLDAFRERVLVDKGAQRRRVRRTGGARRRRRVRPGRARRAADQRGHSGQRRDARHTGPDQPQRICAPLPWAPATSAGSSCPICPTSADVVAGDLLGDLGAGRRISRRLSGRHRRRGQARSRAVPGRRRCAARPRRWTARANSCSFG